MMVRSKITSQSHKIIDTILSDHLFAIFLIEFEIWQKEITKWVNEYYMDKLNQ